MRLPCLGRAGVSGCPRWSWLHGNPRCGVLVQLPVPCSGDHRAERQRAGLGRQHPRPEQGPGPGHVRAAPGGGVRGPRLLQSRGVRQDGCRQVDARQRHLRPRRGGDGRRQPGHARTRLPPAPGWLPGPLRLGGLRDRHGGRRHRGRAAPPGGRPSRRRCRPADPRGVVPRPLVGPQVRERPGAVRAGAGRSRPAGDRRHDTGAEPGREIHPEALEFAAYIESLGLPLRPNGRVVLTNALSDPFTSSPVFGLQTLLDDTYAVVPEVVEAALTAAQMLDIGRKKKVVASIINQAVAVAAGVGATPIPFADAAILVPEPGHDDRPHHRCLRAPAQPVQGARRGRCRRPHRRGHHGRQVRRHEPAEVRAGRAAGRVGDLRDGGRQP